MISYDTAYLRAILLRDAAALKLPAKTTTERLLLTAHYQRAVDEFERFRFSVKADTSATDEEKNEAIRTKAAEDAGIDDRRFTVDAFGHIVEAALTQDKITSCGKEYEPEEWLQTVAIELVDN